MAHCNRRSATISPGLLHRWAGACSVSSPLLSLVATATPSFCSERSVTEKLNIVRLGHRGDGVAETDNGPVYVPYALPGETVTVEVVRGHPDRRHLLHVEKASHERSVPICKHFGACGGCALQHWSLAEYHWWKRSRRRMWLHPSAASLTRMVQAAAAPSCTQGVGFTTFWKSASRHLAPITSSLSMLVLFWRLGLQVHFQPHGP